MAGDAIEVFFSYSHKDEALRDQLAAHLKILERQKIIAFWHDRKILPGTEWSGDINYSLSQADIILLLVSADFLASDYCWDIEIQKALDRHEAGDATVIPVILRPVDWSSAPFAKLQALPKNAQPVVTWTPPDLAFMDIAKGIRRKAEELVASRKKQQAQIRKQAALEQYRQRVNAYLADGPISFIARENLQDLARALELTQAETAAIETKETAIREDYLANLDRYGQSFRQALDHENPLSEATRAQLKDRQTLLNLKDPDVQRIEQSIFADWQAEHQRRQEQAAAERRRQEQAEAERLRQKQELAEHQERERQAEEQRRQEQEAAERRRQEQAEAERIQQQQELAKRRGQERQQREAAEQRRREQAEAERLAGERQEQERQRQVAEAERLARQRQDGIEAAKQQLIQVISRRRVLQVMSFGGGGLAVAVFASPIVEKFTNSDGLESFDFKVVTVNEKGDVTDRQPGQANKFQEDLGSGIGLDMVQIPAGEFVMGSPSDEEGRWDVEGPQRTVTVPSFFMGRFAVTQAQYQAVMGENPSGFQDNGDNRPVEQVSWRDAEAFCEKLSELTGRDYRLPSEAEWEYACRAETQTPFYFGETITTDLANYRGTDWEHEGNTYSGNYGQGPYGLYRKVTTEVGSFPPNPFGLYDIHGNVWEWCADHWHENYERAPKDGTAWLSSDESSRRILRGGSWFDNPRNCRSAYRLRLEPGSRYDIIGFRVCCSAPRTL